MAAAFDDSDDDDDLAFKPKATASKAPAKPVAKKQAAKKGMFDSSDDDWAKSRQQKAYLSFLNL